MNLKLCFAAFFCVLFVGHEAPAAKIRVPQDQLTVAAALAAASNGDTIVVSKGTYLEKINIDGWTNLTIKARGNDKVIFDAEGTGAPLYITSSTGVVIQNLRFQNTTNTAGILVLTCTDVTLKGCRTRTTSLTAVALLGCIGAQVRNCRIESPGNLGVLLDSTSGCVVSGCTITSPGQDGIGARGTADTIENNTIDQAGNHGIHLAEGGNPCASTLVIGNTITASGQDGINANANATGCSIFENRITGGNDGIDLDTGADSLLVYENVVKGSAGNGYELSSDRHMLIGNTVKKAGDNGFFLTLLAQQCLLRGNRSKKAADDGFDIAGTANSFVENSAKKSTGFGLNDSGSQNSYTGNNFDSIAP